MSTRHFVIAVAMIVVHTSVNVGLILADGPHVGWVGVQAILTVLTLWVIVRAYGEPQRRPEPFNAYEVGRRNFTAVLVGYGWTQSAADAEWCRAWALTGPASSRRGRQ